MLGDLPIATVQTRSLRHERKLWHDGAQYVLSLGCTGCHDRNVCGGLQLGRQLYDCMGFCCRKPDQCDAVCRNKPFEFAERVREVGGFDLSNVPRSNLLPAPTLPSLIPVLYHKNNRTMVFDASPAVCLPLYRVIQRQSGEPRFGSLDELAKAFAISPTLRLVLTGTDRDAPLERWWSLGPRRREAIRALRAFGVSLVTTPNYSLFVDQPRWDDLHSMKRIAIAHEEFLSEGVPAALHLNARTETDWSRWETFVAARPEITHVAFEFATGAGWAGRIEWQVKQLIRLSLGVGRPLHLILRGGAKFLASFQKAFLAITVLDTNTFMKTTYRQMATLSSEGQITWKKAPTEIDEPLDALMAQNWTAIYNSHIEEPTNGCVLGGATSA